MGDDPTATPRGVKGKGGRPSRAEASAKALVGVDLTAVDPVKILRAIAADGSMPGSTRVSACKALLALQDGPDGSAVAADAVSVRAQQLLAARRKAN